MLVFSGLSVVLAQALHTSIVDGAVFHRSLNRQGVSLIKPAAIFIVVAVNRLIAFAEMHRVTTAAGT